MTRKSNTAPKSNARASKKADSTLTLEQVRVIFNAEGFDIAPSKAVSGKFDAFQGVGRGRKKIETIDNLPTADNWIKEKIAEKAIATMPPESVESTESTESTEQVTDVAPSVETQEAVSEQVEQVASVQETAPAPMTQQAVTETIESDEDTPAIFYTTASPELDITDATSYEWTDKKTAGAGMTARRWRRVETVRPASQKEAYKAAKFPIKTQSEWDALVGLQMDIDHTVDQFSDSGEFLGKVQKAASSKKAASGVASTKEFWSAKNAPAKSVKAGSKIDTIINMLSAEGGATVQALSDAVGKTMTPSYIAQRLALRNYGMKRIEGSSNYAIVRPEV